MDRDRPPPYSSVNSQAPFGFCMPLNQPQGYIPAPSVYPQSYAQPYPQSSPQNNVIQTKQGYIWVPSQAGQAVPSNAVDGGVDSDGTRMYIGRANFNGDQLPCKVIPQKRAAYVSHNCKEHPVSSYEVLCEQKLRWVRSVGGRVPPGAIQGGFTRSGETLYVGRARHNGSTTVGKVHPSHGCVYIPYGGQEVSCKDYEVLVYN